MDLAWLFIRKPQIDPNEPITKHADRVTASDWGWCIMILGLAGLLIYAVYTGSDNNYPADRGPVYFWISLGALVLAPVYLLPHFLGQRRAHALNTAVFFTLFCVVPVVMASWPASERLIYEPLEPKTWKTLTAKVPEFVPVWLVVTGLLALGTWLYAVSQFIPARTKSTPSGENE